MSRPVRVLTICLWVAAVAGMIGVVALQLWTRNHARAGTPPIYGVTVPAFALTDQLGRTVTNDQLKGHPWVADFIFTDCPTQCPLMTQRLAAEQKAIPPAVKFISFTVDPVHDTPAVLLAYAKHYGADNDRWRFLTGDRAIVLQTVSGMKVTFIPTEQSGKAIEHDSRYLLIDADGHLRGTYHGEESADMDRLVRDSQALAAAGGKP